MNSRCTLAGVSNLKILLGILECQRIYGSDYVHFYYGIYCNSIPPSVGREIINIRLPAFGVEFHTPGSFFQSSLIYGKIKTSLFSVGK